MAIERLGGTDLPQRPDRVDPSPASPGRTPSVEDEGRDRAEFSTEALRVAELAEKVKSLPEIRQDRVDALRARLADGTYRVEPQQLARAILEFEDGLRR
jgi:negative regulator of flagellin synthesis FlgM